MGACRKIVSTAQLALPLRPPSMGKAPLYAGQPGYREDMDGDGDGIACEPTNH